MPLKKTLLPAFHFLLFGEGKAQVTKKGQFFGTYTHTHTHKHTHTKRLSGICIHFFTMPLACTNIVLNVPIKYGEDKPGNIHF